MKIAVLTLGCKVNKYESDALIFKLRELGFEAVDTLEEADAYIINTCAVTNEAERKSRQMIERCRKYNERAKIYVLGCASQNRPMQFEDKGVTFIQGVANKLKIIDHLEDKGEDIYKLPLKYEDDLYSAQTLTRAFIKIQDGCDNFCTYCIIPYLRGRSRSRSVESVISEVEKLPKEVKEVVLVGIDVSSYSSNGNLLIDLLERLDKFNFRLRLSSMEDNLVSEDFVRRLSRLKNFCPHFHLSLQSGCDKVLEKMNRKYTTADFKHTVELIRRYFPLAGITTDVIVGFPTETEEDFEETVKFIKEIKFSDLHIFPYSNRTGTVASKLYKDLPKSIKIERGKCLEEIKKRDKLEFIKKNDIVEILLEEEESGVFYGYSKNYIKCKIKGNFKVGDVVKAKIVKADLNTSFCEEQ